VPQPVNQESIYGGEVPEVVLPDEVATDDIRDGTVQLLPVKVGQEVGSRTCLIFANLS
jgi:hypothetical protein